VSEESLRKTLENWVDTDGAAYLLACALGLMDQSVDFCTRAKHVFWTDDPIGNLLVGMLDEMVENEILEKRDEPDFQYRWNPAFKGSWETRA
jgi:hypothetical protein